MCTINRVHVSLLYMYWGAGKLTNGKSIKMYHIIIFYMYNGGTFYLYA